MRRLRASLMSLLHRTQQLARAALRAAVGAERRTAVNASTERCSPHPFFLVLGTFLVSHLGPGWGFTGIAIMLGARLFCPDMRTCSVYPMLQYAAVECGRDSGSALCDSAAVAVRLCDVAWEG